MGLEMQKDFFTLTQEQQGHIDTLGARLEGCLSEYACRGAAAIRLWPYRNEDGLRSPFAVDCDKIVHNAQDNRYVDKTQVFSFYKNDDITRRALHVQIVSRVARTIGMALGLNLELIEAIALGHDIGHTPFGHRGESYLNELYHENTGRFFNHNVHSVRIFMKLLKTNLTLQTLDGILSHNGEKAFQQYEPGELGTFDGFDEKLEKCYLEEDYIKKLRPGTLEGCVVRISDMIAYIGKDRQDAVKASFKVENYEQARHLKGKNLDILNRVAMNIIKNSIGRPYLSMDDAIFEDRLLLQRENFGNISTDPALVQPYAETIGPLMRTLSFPFVEDLRMG